MATVDTEDLIDSAEVARMLGLAHRNSVSTYLRRYPDFPRPAVVRGDGRINLWLRRDIQGWRPGDASRSAQDTAARHRRALIAAARELMAAHPPAEISVREIAERAGLAHTQIYRHVGSKEDLERAVIEDVVSGLTALALQDCVPLGQRTDAVIRELYAQADAIPILLHAMHSRRVPQPYGDDGPVLRALMAAVRAESAAAEPGPPGPRALPPLSPEEAIGMAAALVIGWVAFWPRIHGATGLSEIPVDRVSELAQALLLAAAGR